MVIGAEGSGPTRSEPAAAGRRRRIDLGLVNDKAFFNVASLGLSADLANGLTHESKRRWGRLAYAREALRVLALHAPGDGERDVRIDVDLSVD